MISWLKPKGVTWRDWWASRTNKVISALLVIFLATQSGDVSLTDLGVPAAWEGFFMSAMGIAVALGLFKLRASTDRPLKGRFRQGGTDR